MDQSVKDFIELAKRFREEPNRFKDHFRTASQLTHEAWKNGRLNTIKSLVLSEKLGGELRAEYRISEPSIFASLIGFNSVIKEMNDKIEWDVDDSGETVLCVEQFKHVYHEPGDLSNWGLVPMRKVYIGKELLFGDCEPLNEEWIGGQNEEIILGYHADVCEFLAETIKANLVNYSEPIYKSDLAKKLILSTKTVQRRIDSGQLRVIDETYKTVRVHIDDLPK